MKRAERNRLAKIAKIEKDPKVKYCYIYKLGSYYGNNCRGYVTYFYEAGIYAKDKAIEICKACTYEIPVPVDIALHNKTLAQEIVKLSKLFIDETI